MGELQASLKATAEELQDLTELGLQAVGAIIRVLKPYYMSSPDIRAVDAATWTHVRALASEMALAESASDPQVGTVDSDTAPLFPLSPQT